MEAAARRGPIGLLRSRIFRLALVNLALFSAGLVVLVAVIYWFTAASVTRQIDATIDAEIRGLAEQYQQRGLPGLVESIRRRSAAETPGSGLYLLYDRQRGVLAGNLSGWPDQRADADGWITFPLQIPERGGGGDGRADAAVDDLDAARARVFELGDRLRLLVGHDVRERSRLAGQIRNTVLLGIAGIIGLSLAGAIFMSRSLLRQIETINRTSREIMAGDLTRRVPVGGRDDEFDRLAGNLNAMLDRNERLLEGMKQVSDNIAHDLRSPLARMRSRLEVTLMEARDAPEWREAVEETIAEADALLETFKSLLSIARAESGEPSAGFRPLDLAQVARDAAEFYEALAEEQGLAFSVEIEGPLTIRSDPQLLFQALGNLLDNAVKFSPPGGAVRLTLSRDSGTGLALLRVADEGPGIPAGAREKVQERFYRLESSRSTPGSGLGLSLVAAVAALHGGRLVLSDSRPGQESPGLLASLELPLAEPPESPAGASD